MLEERTSAIVLRTRPYGESDKIVTFLTRDWGKLIGIAKGAKRSRQRFVNVLEPFTHVQLRFRPGRADDLAFIFGCDVLRRFRGPSQDLQRFALASYMVELIDVMVAGRESGQETYALLLDGLLFLEEHPVSSPLFLPVFEFLLLTYVGYAPHLAGCQQCGVPLNEDKAPVIFSPGLGGLLCASCRGRGGACFLLSADTLQVLRRPKDQGLRAFLQPATSPRVSQEVRALVSRLLPRHLSRPLRSLAFLEQAGIPRISSIDAPQGE